MFEIKQCMSATSNEVSCHRTQGLALQQTLMLCHEIDPSTEKQCVL